MEPAVPARFGNLKIGQRLVAGFAAAIVVLAGLIAFTYTSLTDLAELHVQSAGRAADAIGVSEMAGHGAAMYQVVADAVINRDLEATRRDWKAITEELDADIAHVATIVDTPEEVAWHKQGAEAYRQFVEVVEREMLPLLARSDVVAEEIRELDARLDVYAAAFADNYGKVRESIVREAEAAHESFDTPGADIIVISVVVAVIGVTILVLAAIRPRRVDARFFFVGVVLGAAILLFDLSLPLGVASGVLYVALVLIGLWIPGQRYVLGLAAIATALTVLGYLYSPSGGVAWVVLTNRALAIFAIWITALLIAHRKQVEEALRESETRFTVVVNHAPTKIHIKDLAGRYLLVNREAEKLFGVTDEEARGKTTHEIFPEKQASDFKAHDRAVLETGQTIEQEEQWELDDGVHTYLTVKFPIRNGDGEITAIGAIGTDITERKRAEMAMLAAMKEAETATRTKSEFLANMSHELRTPLNAIIGFSDIMKDERLGPIGSTKYREYADDIHESGQHLLALINDILDLSKVESGTDKLYEENIEISEMANAVMKLGHALARNGNIALELEMPDDVPVLHADERKVKQILLNLLSNAIKFTPDGGKVTLRIWSRAESGCVFQVIDTGIGIASEDIPTALTPFQQIDSGLNRKHEGTGLGLPLTKSLVEMHGGYLDLQSKVGVGTTVTVRFPADRIVCPLRDARAVDVADMKAG